MANLRFCLFLAALCSCSVLGLGEETVPSLKDTESVVIPAVQVNPKDTEVTPVKEEEVLAPVTTTEDSEAKRHNTTTSSTTSTTTTTTTPSTTTSTTTTTTTTPAPPPPKPQPVPAPDQGTWVYTEANVTCIIVQFAAQITISYTQTVMNKTTIANLTMNVPANATVLGGDCNATATDQWMKLGWPSVEGGPDDNSILLWYRRNESKTYALETFNLTINASQLVNMSIPIDTLVLSHGEEWSTPLATSYRCMPVTKISMSNSTYSASASVAVSRLQEEAFRSTPGKSFSAARECGSGDVPDTVPIAVGCALGGLVLVVLIAYLVARYRSAAHGYLSM